MDEDNAEDIVLPLDDVVWDNIEYLRPGFDHKAGTTYMTFPIQQRVMKKEKHGKEVETKVVIENNLYTVTSEKRRFWFTPENLEALNFLFPKYVTVEGTPRWRPRDIKAYTDDDAKGPDTVALFNEIRSIYEKHIEFADETFYDLMPLYIMGSYVFRLFSTVPYIHFNGTKASGKSQNLKILRALGFNTTWTANMSASSLFRGIAGMPGVVCIDEAESFQGERGEEIRLLLNSGYAAGANVRRVERTANERFEVQEYEVFGPKAIASINPLEPVIKSRSIVIGMRPALRAIPEFRYEEDQWFDTRNRLYLWALENATNIAALINEWRETLRHTRAADLKNRYWETGQMFIVLADYINQGDLADRIIRFLIENYQTQTEQENAADRMLILLRCLPEVLRTKQPDDEHWYSIKTIHEVVSAYIEEDSKEYYKTRSVGKNLTSMGFTKRRPHKQGQQVYLDNESVRQAIRERRVEVPDEDKPWLAGEVEYNGMTLPTPTDEEPDDEDFL